MKIFTLIIILICLNNCNGSQKFSKEFDKKDATWHFLEDYNKKFLDKNLSNYQIAEICNKYTDEAKVMKIIENVDGLGLRTYADINYFCETNRLRSITELKANYEYIKALDIEKVPFALISNNYFSLKESVPDISKNQSCVINLNDEEDKWMDFLDIKKRCNIERLIEVNGEIKIEHQEFFYEISDTDEESSLEGDWIKIVDYFYGDYNDDNYLDLIVRLNRDGSYSAPSQTSTIIITSFKESEFQIIL